MEKFTLTEDNYHGVEANRLYKSVSQLKAFVNCPSGWRSKYVEGKAEDQKSKAMLIGSYVDVALLEPEKLYAFKDANRDDLHQKNGKLYAEFRHADTMVEAVRGQDAARRLIDRCRERQNILTGEVFGHTFKCKLDMLDPATGCLVDLKTTRDVFHREWVPRHSAKMDWITVWDYWLQMYVYMEICEQNGIEIKECLILAVDSKPIPAVRLFDMNVPSALMDAKRRLQVALKRLQDGSTHAERCEACNHCRSTHVLSQAPFKYVDGYWK